MISTPIEAMSALLDAAALGLLVLNQDGQIVLANSTLAALFGYAPDELLGQPLRLLLPDDVLNAPQRNFSEPLRTRVVGQGISVLGQRKDGQTIVVEASLSQLQLGEQVVPAILVIDTTKPALDANEYFHLLQQEQQARVVAEAAQRRLEFLSDASQCLHASLDNDPALCLAQLCLPMLGDGCVVTLFNDDQSQTVHALHVVPAKQARLRELVASYSPATAAPTLLADTSAAVLDSATIVHLLAGATPSTEQAQLLAALGSTAAIAVPISGHDQALGTLIVLATEDERRYAEDDLTLVRKLALIAAQAIENVRRLQAAQASIWHKDEELAIRNIWMQSAPLGLAFQDRELRYQLVNPQFAAMGGLPLDRYIGHHVRELFPRLAEFLEPMLQRVLDTGEPLLDVQISDQLSLEVGQTCYWVCNYYPVRTDEGTILGLGAIVRDITKRKQTEAALHQQTVFAKLLQVIAVAANQAVSVAEALQTAINEVCTCIGWSVGHAFLRDEAAPEQLLSTDIWYFDQPERFAIFRTFTESLQFVQGKDLPGQVLENGEPLWIADIRTRKDIPRAQLIRDIGVRAGFAFPILVGSDVVAVLEFFATEPQAPNDALLHVLANVGTQLGRVVERARAEAALRVSEEYYRLIAENTADIILLLDHARSTIYISPSFQTTLGYDPALFIGGTLDEIIHPDDLANMNAAWARIRTEGECTLILRYRTAQNTWRWIETCGTLTKQTSASYIVVVGHDVTERRQVEEALRAAESQYRALVEQLPAIIYTAGADTYGRTNYVSPQVETMFGFTSNEWLANPQLWLEQTHPDDRARVLDDVALTQESLVPVHTEYRSHTRDGRMIWLRDTAKVVRNADGERLFLLGVTLDITDRKEAEEALREAEARYRTLVEQLPAIIYTANIDEDSSTIYVSPQIEAILGFTPEEWLANPVLWLEQIHPDDRARIQANAVYTQASSGSPPIEYRSFTRDNRVVWLQDISNIVRDANGQALFMQGITFDITERKEAEESARRSDQLYRTLVRSFPNGAVFQFDCALRFTIADGETIRAFGGLPEDIEGRTLDDVLSKEMYHIHEPLFRAALAGTPSTAEATYRDRIFTVYYVPVRDDHGEIFAGWAIVHDITERKAAESALRRSEEMYRTLARNFPNGAVFMFDHDLRYTIADGRALVTMGLARSAIEGHTIWDVMPPILSAQVESSYRLALAGTPSVEEMELREHVYLVHTTPVADARGQIIAGMVTCLNITELKHAERALIEERTLLAWRVEERTADLSAANASLARASQLKDEFLASMSHELRTPLNAVLGLSEALREQVYGVLNGKQDRAVQMIEESGNHLLQLINDILDLAKIGADKLELAFEPTNIAQVCQSSLHIVQQAASKKQISIDLTLDPAVLSVRADARRLMQILVNLLANAVKFTAPGGKVGLTVAADLAQQIIRFTVWDTGIGIEADQLERLFQPFVQLDSRLSRNYEGTGLGLTLVYRMTELHGGSVSVASRVGVGSRFTIALPWHGDKDTHTLNEPVTSTPEHQLISSAKEIMINPLQLNQSGLIRRALIVEDSSTAAALLKHYLAELHINAHALALGVETVAWASEHQPDVILLDILLADVSGWDVLAQLKAEAQTRALPVIIISAVDDQQRGLDHGAAAYLTKPYTYADLQRVLHQIATPVVAAPPPARTPQPHKQQTILLAEDNELNIITMADYLTTLGYNLVTARTGMEAVMRAREVHPALILMDVQMPQMNGLEATRRIRADAQTALIPIIALTALAMSGDRERCIEAGVNDYLSKPISLATLTDMIATYIEQHEAQS